MAGVVMTKIEIFDKIKLIITVLDLLPPSCLFEQSAVVYHVGALDDVLLKITANENQEQKLERFGYFCHLLLDCPFDEVRDDIKKLFTRYIKERLEDESLRNILIEYRRPKAELLKFIIDLPAPSLKELVYISGTTPQESWQDPLTNKVMDIPVSYIVGDIRYTCDLITLLKVNLGKCLILCPRAKQYILLSDITPRDDIVKDIQDNCPNTYGSKDIKAELNYACWYAKQGDVEKLKAWHRKSPEIHINTPLLDDRCLNWTIAHLASHSGAFDVLCWLLEGTGVDLCIKNTKGKTPLNLLTRHLDKLKTACQEQPDNHALQLLLIIYCHHKQCLENIEKNYSYALLWQGLQMANNQNSLDEGLIKIARSIELGAKAALSSMLLLLLALGSVNEGLLARTEPLFKDSHLMKIVAGVLGRDDLVVRRAFIEYYYGQFMGANNPHTYVGHCGLQSLYYLNLAFKRLEPTHSMFDIYKSSLRDVGLKLGMTITDFDLNSNPDYVGSINDNAAQDLTARPAL